MVRTRSDRVRGERPIWPRLYARVQVAPLQKSRLYENGQRTRRRLIETALTLYDEGGGRIPSSPSILERSGISKGSLYHHFHGFDALMQAALQVRYVDLCDRVVVRFWSIFETATEKQDVERRLRTLCQVTFSPDLGVLRLVYAHLITYTVTSDQVIAVYELQHAHRGELAEIIRDAQERSFLDNSMNTERAAFALQGLILGPPLDHPTSTVTAYAWTRTLDSMLAEMFRI